MKRQTKDLLLISNEWLSFKELYIKQSSYDKYQAIITNHLSLLFNENNNHYLTEKDITEFFLRKSKTECLSLNTLKSIITVLKAILQYAHHEHNYPVVSFTYIRLTSLPRKEVKPLDKISQQIIIDHCMKNKNTSSFAILLALYGGLRLGEICALKWQDIDYSSKYIIVSKTVKRVVNRQDNLKNKTKLIIDIPKTNSSNRIVVIPNILLDYFYNYLKDNIDNQEAYILSNKSKIPDPRTLQLQYKRICKLYNIDTNFHALRHSYATNGVQLGVDIKTLSELLGHSSVNITLNRYVHSALEYKLNQINKLNNPSLS